MTAAEATDLPETKRVRAASLPPSERRAEIVATTLPLLIEHGAALTTRQIAEAAGIAEGTIFRVFEDKHALIDAVVEAAIDPAPTEAALREIDLGLPLEERMVAAVEILRRRVSQIFQLMSAVGAMRSAADRPDLTKPKVPSLEALAAVLEPDRAALNRDPEAAAHVLRGLTLVGTHPLMILDEPMPSAEIVELVLDGIHAPDPMRVHRDPTPNPLQLLLEPPGTPVLIRLLVTYLKRYRKTLLAVVGLQIIATAAALTLPTLNADIIDKGVLTGDTDYIYKVGGLMLLVTLIQVVFAVWAVYYGSRAAMGFGRDVRKGLFHQVTGFSTQEVSSFGAPSLITRITNDVTQVQMLVLMSCTLLVAAPITIIGGVIMAIREDGPLSLLLLVSVPALVIGVGSIIWRLVPTFGEMQVRIDRVNQVLREQITGIRVVRAFVREPHEKARFSAGNDDLTETSLRAGQLMAFMFPIVMFILNASSVVAIWFGANRIDSGDMQIGALIAFLTYLVQILMSVMMATFVAVMAPRASVCADRIQEVLNTPSTVVDPEAPVTSLPAAASLELRNVTFAYPGAEAPVLCDISFRAEAGTTTAIIGSTGSGKTTLLNLVPRLFDATSGEVLVDGVNVRDIEPELLWAQVGLVPQKPYLFSGTVASNLRYADPEATDEDLWEALGIAQATSFVRDMPEGLGSTIAQGGTNVSGGQRQRLAIARALARKPGIFLFDDSFSALDLATDARLRAALEPVTRNSVMIVVAQRVSTISRADQILVLEDGEQVGLGTHLELLESCPTYQEIVASQLTEEEAA